ncbi:unnamed protein product [Rotaria sp. Silwood2]|nr:unnamed protein product [Rotaria sp. Silwood2]CAF4232469.1 unnamed protein product [Rotaria sp. Silwood2]CAF4337600.1 unnamed protein product [Rotaria sp. Silwood2]CAF4358859.1 unnamed protein product [Rotaria sp. Silwood2]
MESFEQSDNDLTPTLPVKIRKVPKSLEEIVRITKFNKSEIRLLYKGFKQECPSGAVTEREFQAIYSHFFPHGKCQHYTTYLFRVLDRRKRMYFTFETIETILRSIYDLLGPNHCLHQPFTDATIEKHSAFIFAKLDVHHVGSINLDDFEKYCLHDEQLLNTIKLLSATAI